MNQEQEGNSMPSSPHVGVLQFPISTPLCLSSPVIFLWSSCLAVAKTRIKGWFKGSHCKPLTKRSNRQGRRTIWGSLNPPWTDNWLPSPYALLMELDILGVQHTFPQMSVNIQPHASHAVYGWFEIRVWPTRLSWLPKTCKSHVGRRAFAFILTL